MSDVGLEDIRAGGRAALARALSRIESDHQTDALIQLLDKAFQTPKGLVIGLTGPPGVGKSTLVQALIHSFRDEGETVGVIAIDPTSPITGGALLGDRTRLKTDPTDEGIFVRSFSAGDRLGGLSGATIAATVLMQALFDRVIVETVGVGQSEADISLIADTTLVCIQPGSGDSLQFMKAGIMEVPDIIAVTKSDLGAPAARAIAEVEGALGLSGRQVTVLALSAVTRDGLADLVAELRLQQKLTPIERSERTKSWLQNIISHEFGQSGWRSISCDLEDWTVNKPFQSIRAQIKKLTT